MVLISLNAMVGSEVGVYLRQHPDNANSQAAFHVGPGWAPVGQSWAPNGPRVGLTGAHLGMLLGLRFANISCSYRFHKKKTYIICNNHSETD